MDLDWNRLTGLTIQIQNPILTLDCQSQSNPLNWIAIRIEQSNNPIQQYPDFMFTFFPATSLGLEFISDKRTSLILQNGTLETDIFDLIQFSMVQVNLKHNICHLKESLWAEM